MTRGCVCYATWSAWRAEPEGSSCGFCTKPSAAPAPPLSLPAAAAGPPWAPDGRAGLAVLLALAWGAGCSSFPSLLLRQAAPSPACIFQRFLDVSLPLFPLNFRGGSAVLRSRGGPRVRPSSLSGGKPVHSVSWGRGERLAGRGESPGRAATAGLGLRPPEPFVPTPLPEAQTVLWSSCPPPTPPPRRLKQGRGRSQGSLWSLRPRMAWGPGRSERAAGEQWGWPPRVLPSPAVHSPAAPKRQPRSACWEDGRCPCYYPMMNCDVGRKGSNRRVSFMPRDSALEM